MEYMEILICIAALIFSVHHLIRIIEFWRNHQANANKLNSKNSSEHESLSPILDSKRRSKSTFFTVTKYREQLTGNSEFSELKLCASCSSQDLSSKEGSDFYEIGRLILELIRKKALVFKLAESSDWLSKLIDPMTRDDDKYELFVDTVLGAMEHRSRSGIRKDDVIALLTRVINDPNKLSNIELSDVLVTANAFAYFASGFGVTANDKIPKITIGQLFQKLREDMLKSEESEAQEDEEGDDTLAVEECNKEANSISTVETITNLRRYVMTKLLMYLSDPTVPMAKKTLIVSTGVLIMFSVYRFFPQIRRELGNVCRAMHAKCVRN